MKRIYIILFSLFLAFNTQAKEDISASDIDSFMKEFEHCTELFQSDEQKCPETWTMKCYNHLLSAHGMIQKCYKNVAVKLFEKFYGLSSEEASTKIDEYNKFIYNQYLFIYNDTSYCKQNNCGVSPYLYSEYATTQSIQDYIQRIIKSIDARN